MLPTVAFLREILSYEPETGALVWKVRRCSVVRAGDIAGSVNAKGYRYITVRRKHLLAHRVAWAVHTGSWPTEDLDHENGCKDDNRFRNLRPASKRLNQENQRRAQKNNPWGLLGVSKASDCKRWLATIQANGVVKRLGRFDTPELAHAAYLEAKRKLHEGCTV